MASIDEYKIFINSMPESQREYRTIEIFHPDFSSIIRLVQDYVNISLALEADAPRDPSTSQVFQAASIQINEPGENGEIEQVLSISMGAVGNLVNDRLSEIVDHFAPVELIYRKYYSGDLSSPVIVLSMSAADVSFKGFESVTFSGEDTNFAIKRAGELYTIERFPALRTI